MSIIEKLQKARETTLLTQIRLEARLERLVRENKGKRK